MWTVTYLSKQMSTYIAQIHRAFKLLMYYRPENPHVRSNQPQWHKKLEMRGSAQW